MKIAIKVSDISSLLNYNNFKTREIVIKNIKARLYRTSKFSNLQCGGDLVAKVEHIVRTFSPQVGDIELEHVDFADIVTHEFDNFYVYCFGHELVRRNGVLIDRKLRISQKVKNFIPIIDLVHVQFYMMLAHCRRCLLDEVWEDGHVRKTYIKYEPDKITSYVEMLANTLKNIM